MAFEGLFLAHQVPGTQAEQNRGRCEAEKNRGLSCGSGPNFGGEHEVEIEIARQRRKQLSSDRQYEAKPRQAEERNDRDDAHETDGTQRAAHGLLSRSQLRFVPDDAGVWQGGACAGGNSFIFTQEFGEEQNVGADSALFRVRSDLGVYGSAEHCG